MKSFIVALCLFALASIAAGDTKQIILSSIRIYNTHEELPTDDPEIQFGCQFNPSGNTVTEVTPIGGALTDLTNVDKINLFYVVEKFLFTWDNETNGNFIVCTTHEADTIGDGDSLGISTNINFNLIDSQGRLLSTQGPHESDFYLRCGDCYAPISSDQPATKEIGIKSMQISDKQTSIPFTDPDLYVECNNAGPTVYTMNLKGVVTKSKEDTTVNRRFEQWIWDPSETNFPSPRANSSSQGATCGIYVRGFNNGLDGLGTRIITYSNITTDGVKYTWPDDPQTWIVFKICGDDDCNSTSMLSVSIVAIVAIVLALF